MSISAKSKIRVLPEQKEQDQVVAVVLVAVVLRARNQKAFKVVESVHLLYVILMIMNVKIRL